jgi:hypothetical protein
LHVLMGEKTLTMGNKKLSAYTFTKNARPQFHLLPDAGPWIILVCFSMMSF